MAEQLLVSIYSVICFIYLIARYRILSVEFIVSLFVYVPSLSVLYRVVMGADFVNYQNFALQENNALMAYSISLLCLSFTITLVVLHFKRNEKSASLDITRTVDHPRNAISQLLLITLFLVFFTLSDKGGLGDSIFNTSYTDLLSKRVNNTEYAATLGIIFWIWSFLTFLNRKKDFIGRKINIIFILATIWNLIWLFLHSSRMLFLLIANSYILYLILSKRKKLALTLLVISIFALTVLGWVREALYNPALTIFNEDESVSVASLPGGASNVLMSFVITCDYFKDSTFYYGETFLNYLFQLPPGPLARLFNYEPPPYFDSIGIFDRYDWNGGINAASIFYANFGVIGICIYGIFVGVYIKSIVYLLKSKRVLKQTAGYFMFSYSIPVFWYEIIQFIKPILFILFLFIVNKIIIAATSKNALKHSAID